MELPAGWERATLADILLRIEAGKSFTCEPRPARMEEWGIVKVSAMTWGEFNGSANKAVPTGKSVDQSKEIRPGDILVSRANTRSYVGAPVLVRTCRPRLLLSDKSLRLVPSPHVNKKWILYTLASPEIREYISAASSGTKDAMRNISQRVLEAIPVTLPPLTEQHRIVEALEYHLSRHESATKAVELSHQKVEALRRSSLLSLVPEEAPPAWRRSTVNEAGRIDLGRQRHPDWHTGPGMKPYLRVANVFEDRIDTSDVMEMDFSGVFDRFRLEPGDILLNEGQSPHLVGRPAMYRGDPPEVAFTNSLLRFRANPDVLPEWALLVFRRHLHARRFMREVRITTNIAHLSAARLKPIEFPVPPLEEQKRLVALAEDRFRAIDALDRELAKAQRRADHLRKAILSRAFTGGLVPQDPADEPASELLARIQAERAAQPKPKRTRRTPSQRKAETTTEPEPKPAPTTTTPLPQTAIQQEFEL